MASSLKHHRVGVCSMPQVTAPGMQTYDRVLQMPGKEADALPCERIRRICFFDWQEAKKRVQRNKVLKSLESIMIIC